MSVANLTSPGVTGAASSGHLPSLDGLRGVSILLLLLAHLSGTRNFITLPKVFGDLGHLGVLVFFTISGFLITTLLMAETAKRGRISLKLFYARRAVRIFPAYYLFLAVLWLLSRSGWIHLTSRDLWYAGFYWMNHLPLRSWEVGHLWSLSVEEQFYLLWPFTFAVLGPRRAIWAAAAMLAVSPLGRGLANLFLRGTPYQDLEMFPMVADSLAAGCLLALGRGWLEAQSWYWRLLEPRMAIFTLAVVLFSNRMMIYTIGNVAGLSVINVGLALLIHRCVHFHQDPAGRLLNWRPLTMLGLMSYSLYLWQQLFLNRYSTQWINAFPQNLLLTAGAGAISYLAVEKPLQRLRHYLRA